MTIGKRGFKLQVVGSSKCDQNIQLRWLTSTGNFVGVHKPTVARSFQWQWVSWWNPKQIQTVIAIEIIQSASGHKLSDKWYMTAIIGDLIYLLYHLLRESTWTTIHGVHVVMPFLFWATCFLVNPMVWWEILESSSDLKPSKVGTDQWDYKGQSATWDAMISTMLCRLFICECCSRRGTVTPKRYSFSRDFPPQNQVLRIW